MGTEEHLIVHADSLEWLRGQPDNSIDAVVTDPPYGLAAVDKSVEALTAWLAGDREYVPQGRGFVGKSWDAFVPPPALWDEVLRVLKPGGHALVFSSPRTQDLMGLSIRLAGFEIRDSIAMINGQSMPKSSNLAKSVGPEWEGWGTTLKIANDPVLVARKPFKTTTAKNVAQWGTGGLNIDACRTEYKSAADKASAVPQGAATSRPGSFASKHVGGNGRSTFEPVQSETGRWPTDVVFCHLPECRVEGTKEVRSDSHHPANRGAGGLSTSGHKGQTGLVERSPGTEVVPNSICAPGCPVAALDAESGVLKSGANPTFRSASKSIAMSGGFNDSELVQHRGADEGGASRFFPAFHYSPKAKPSERPEVDGVQHVSVKPLEAMRWLVRLVCPPGGVVLDPFGGSGTTAEACLLEGFRSISVEREADYVKLIEARLARHEDRAA